MLLLALFACPGKVDPLAEQRKALAALIQQPLQPGWPAEGAVSLPEPVIDELVTVAVEGYVLPKQPYVVRAPFRMGLLVTPVLDDLQVEVSDSEACLGCVDLGMTWQGTLAVKVRSPLGDGDYELGWSATSSLTAEIYQELLGIDQLLRMRRARGTELDLDVVFDGIPEPFNTLTTAFLENQVVEAATTKALARPLTLLELPGGGPMRVRDLRVRVDDGVVVELAFATLERGVVALPEARDEWEVLLSSATLLGLAQAASLRDEPDGGYIVEPRTLVFEEGRFVLGLRVWRDGKGNKWRDYVVDGTVDLRGGEVTFIGDDAREVDKTGWGGDVKGKLVKARVLKHLERAVLLSIPARFEERVGRRRVIVEPTVLLTSESGLRLRGTVSSEEAR